MQSESALHSARSEIKILLIIFIILIIAAVIVGDIMLQSRVKSYLRARQPDFVFQAFIKDIQSNQLNAAYALTSSDYRANLAGTKSSPIMVSGAQPLAGQSIQSIDPQIAFNQVLQLPQYQNVKNSYTLYKSLAQPNKTGAQIITARFKKNQTQEYDMSAQLSKVNGSWRLDSVSIPDPIDGVTQ